MTKSKSSSTSKIKLANKSSNKRTKPKHKQNVNKQIVAHNKTNGTSARKVVKKEAKVVKKEAKVAKHVEDDGDLDDVDDEEELGFSDEEMLEYVNENAENLSFISNNLSESNNNGKKNSKEKNAGYEKVVKEKDAGYEKVARSFSKVEEEDASKVELLPLKGERGLIQRSRHVQVVEGSEEAIEDEDIAVVNVKPTTTTKVLSMVQLLAHHQVDVNEKKVKIAHLSQQIIENTDKVGSVKELINLCARGQPVAVRKLSLLSLVEVFKDIIPSYRIRELTEQERLIKVSRDVCALREFENSLLTNYQKYLAVLEDNIKDCLKLLKKHTKVPSNKTRDSLKPMVSIATVSAQCLCELVKCVPHFNFRSNIIEVVVPKIELMGELLEVGKICFNGVKAALMADKVGDVSLEVVKAVNKLVKSKVHVKPQVLEVLLFLQLNSDAIRAWEEKGNKMERLKKKREAINKMSKKEKKYKKFEDQLNKEMQEAEAVENKDKVERLHTELLNFLFVIYFRVLKTDHVTSLLPPVLQGLAKFSHLINVEFFHDLMLALEKILKTENVRLRESLNCVRTAVKIISGQGEILTIDPKQFYTELYCRLLFISADGVDGDITIAKSCVEDLILKRRKQVSIVQVMGFFKRLGTILLQLDAEDAVDYLLLIRSILQTHSKCDHVLDNDSCSRGAFQPEVSDPDYSNAESSTLWELNLLHAHYHPVTNTISTNVAAGAPSQGTGALSTKFLNRYSKTSQNTDDSDTYFPDFVPEKSPTKCRSHTNMNTWNNENLRTTCMQQHNFISTLHSDHNLDQLFPSAKRKKCNTD